MKWNALDTLSHKNSNAENCLAGPSQGSSSRPHVIRNGRRYWSCMVCEDAPEEPNRNENEKEGKAENERLRKKEKSSPIEKKEEKTEEHPTENDKKTDNKEKASERESEDVPALINPVDPFFPDGNLDLLNFYSRENLYYLQTIEAKNERKLSIQCAATHINWIVDVNGIGNPFVVEHASWYLTNYVTRIPAVNDHELKVITAACFWISSKMDDRRSILSMSQLVTESGAAFTEEELVAAERRVLKKLKVPKRPVGAHDFVPYLSWYCNTSDSSGPLEAAAVFLCQCGLMTDETLRGEYPSVLAAAAVRTALVFLYLESELIKLESCPVYQKACSKGDLDTVCTKLFQAGRGVASEGYQHKAPLIMYNYKRYIGHYNSLNLLKTIKSFNDLLC